MARHSPELISCCIAPCVLCVCYMNCICVYCVCRCVLCIVCLLYELYCSVMGVGRDNMSKFWPFVPVHSSGQLTVNGSIWLQLNVQPNMHPGSVTAPKMFNMRQQLQHSVRQRLELAQSQATTTQFRFGGILNWKDEFHVFDFVKNLNIFCQMKLI